MYRRLFAICSWIVVAVMVLAACGGAPAAATEAPKEQPKSEAPTQPPAKPEGKVKVALLMTGTITDGGWNQLAYEGLKELEKDSGFEVSYSENVAQAKIPEVARGYGDDGYNLIIGHGFEFGSAFLEIGPMYPKQWFFATTFKPQDEVPANVRYVDAAYFDAAYGAGALAALQSKSKVVGFVGGGDNPTQQNMMKAFIKGAEVTVAGTKGLGVVTGDYNNASKGREAATTMIGNGADVIWHAADVTGLGAIEGAVSKNATVLGCYSDQTNLAPKNMGSSLVMDLGKMVITLAQEVRDGKFKGGEEWKPTVKEMWHWSYNNDKDHNPDVISDAVWGDFSKIWEDVAARKIDVNALISGEAAQPPAEPGKKVKVALLMTGTITDGGWNQLAYEGLKELEKDSGFEVSYSENVAQAKIPEVARGYGDDGFDLIIGHGFEFGSAFLEIGPMYPKQWFFATTFKPQDEVPANVRYVDAAYFDAAYGAGALAALQSKSKVVGFVGGGDNPTQQNMMKAFIKGAEVTVAGTKGLGVVTGDYNNASKGREAATTMIGNGADVIWHAADVTGLGAIEGAVSKNATVLGCYSDQTNLAPKNMGSSLVMDLGKMVITLAQEVRDGKFKGGEEWKPTVKEMWHWSYNNDKDHNPDVISDAVWGDFSKIWEDVAARKIDVNTLIK